jgi:hypothetical protein
MPRQLDPLLDRLTPIAVAHINVPSTILLIFLAGFLYGNLIIRPNLPIAH